MKSFKLPTDFGAFFFFLNLFPVDKKHRCEKKGYKVGKVEILFLVGHIGLLWDRHEGAQSFSSC